MKRRTTPAFVAGCILLLGGTGARAQVPAPATPGKTAISAGALRRLDSLFHYLDSTGFYNGNILVAAGGDRKAFAAIGYASLETGERLSESSTFELASVSKQFTAFGILRLVAAGRLRLDQKLETIFPGFPYKGVSIRNLLDHTCGLPDYMTLLDKHWDRTRIATNSDVLRLLTTYHPATNFEPGSNWEYSNTGYALLASVIESVSGKSYADYMREAVFAPLGLSHTQVYMRRYAPRRIDGYAYGYVQNEDGSYKLPDVVKGQSHVVYLDGIAGDGAVNTTAGDLLRWNNAVRDRKLLPEALWKEALTPPVIQGTSTGYGFGLLVAQHPERGLILSHNGSWPGYASNNVLFADLDIALIFLGNMEADRNLSESVYTAVRNIVFDKPAAFPKPLLQVEARVDHSEFGLYAGTYTSTERPDFEISVRVDGKRLFVQATGQGELEIKPEAQNRFFVAGAPIAIEFVSEDGKPATTLLLHQNGTHPFKRKS